MDTGRPRSAVDVAAAHEYQVACGGEEPPARRAALTERYDGTILR